MSLICLALIVPGAGVVMEQVAQGQSPPAAALASIGLGLALGGFGYLLDRRSLRRWRARREQDLLASYGRVHCRDSRTLEATSESLVLSCKCGLVARPWSELTGFTETPFFLIPLTRIESFAIPKSAFASEGELTEFRRLILDKLHNDRPFNACPIEFAHTRADLWRAKWLHVRKGGGWRRVLKIGFELESQCGRIRRNSKPFKRISMRSDTTQCLVHKPAGKELKATTDIRKQIPDFHLVVPEPLQ